MIEMFLNIKKRGVTLGIIFDIQRMSVHDGPGIRTTVFLKGCSLACKWCHNPESYRKAIQLQYLDEKCILCRRCQTLCPLGVHRIIDKAHLVDFQKCNNCGACVRECPSTALDFFGKEMTAQDVIDEAARDDLFFGEDGGLTFSGGEVLVQIPFLTQLLQTAKDKGYHTCVDTTGNAPFEKWAHILPLTDMFLYDVKAISPEIHKEGTGVDNSMILKNLKTLVQQGQRIQIRIPLIKEYNATVEEVTKMADFLHPLQIEGVTLMPYHVLGKSKRDMIGMEKGATLNPPTKEEMECFRNIFKERQITLI